MDKRRTRLALALGAVLAACVVLAPVASGAARSPQPRVSLAAPAEASSGSSTMVTGRVTAFAGAGRVQLQTRRQAAWRSLAGSALRRGRFRISFVLAGVGTASVRAALLAGGRRIATSPTKRIHIRGATEPPGSPATPPTPSSPPPAEPAPPPPPVETPPVAADYWGAWIGPQFTGTPAPEDMSAVGEFERLAGKPLSLLETFSAWATCSGTDPTCRPTQPFPRPQLEAIRDYGAIPLYSWASECNGEANDEPEFQLADIIAGNFDSYIRGWAEEAAAWGHPFFLRFDWEMNGNWFPWSESLDGNHAGEFITAWRHVHDIFSEVGATNATWVWCPYVNPNGNLQSPATLYPGDEYVDWTCLDGYNKGTISSPTAKYRGFDYLFAPNYAEITGTIAPSKPMLLAEVASSEQGGSKSEWITEMFRELPSAYPQVRGLMWFDYYDQGNDWPIETSTSATEAFAAGISDSRYLSNSFAASAGGPVPVP